MTVPPPPAWPPAVKKFLVRRLLDRYFAPHGSEDAGWLDLLRTTVAGAELQGARVPWSVTAEEAYAIVLTLTERKT